MLAIPFWWSIGLPLWPDVALQIGVAALVFALFAVAFALGAMGGGDVKLIARARLVAAVAGGARRCCSSCRSPAALLTLAMLIRHKLAQAATGKLEIPYGVAIAFGGLWLISERFLNQFG